MTKYRADFLKWQRAWLEQELAKAGGLVSRMAAANGLNRAHAYQLCERAGIKVSDRPGRCLPRKEGNAAWRALDHEPRA